MITSYETLQQAISDWLLHPDAEAAIPSFIALAEASFNRRLRLRAMVKQVQLIVRNYRTTLPDDFLEAKKVQFDNPVRILDYVTPVQLATLQTIPARYYSIMGQHLILRADTFTGTRPPEQLLGSEQGGYLLWDDVSEVTTGDVIIGDPIGLSYYGKLQPLSAEADSNRLLDVAPDIYLWGSLMQSASFLRDDARIGVWKSLFDQAVEEQRIADDRAEHGNAPLVVRQRNPY